MYDSVTPVPARMPRLSPRLPVGPRCLILCRSGFARDLRAVGRGVVVTVALISAVATFLVGVNAAAAVYAASAAPCDHPGTRAICSQLQPLSTHSDQTRRPQTTERPPPAATTSIILSPEQHFTSIAPCT